MVGGRRKEFHVPNKDFEQQKKQQPQAGQQQGGGRKNEEEVGEPVQLPEDKSRKQGEHAKPEGQEQGGNR
jgi:hypothetical protein